MTMTFRTAGQLPIGRLVVYHFTDPVAKDGFKCTCDALWARCGQSVLSSKCDDQSCGKLSWETSGGRNLGKPHTHGSCDLVAICSKSNDKTNGSNEDNPDGWIGTLWEETLLVDIPDGCERTCHVTNFSSTMSKDHTASREHLQERRLRPKALV